MTTLTRHSVIKRKKKKERDRAMVVGRDTGQSEIRGQRSKQREDKEGRTGPQTPVRFTRHLNAVCYVGLHCPVGQSIYLFFLETTLKWEQ